MCRSESGSTPLYSAAEKGLVDIAAVLVSAGADVSGGTSALPAMGTFMHTARITSLHSCIHRCARLDADPHCGFSQQECCGYSAVGKRGSGRCTLFRAKNQHQ